MEIMIVIVAVVLYACIVRDEKHRRKHMLENPPVKYIIEISSKADSEVSNDLGRDADR